MDACGTAHVEGRAVVAPCASTAAPGGVHFVEEGDEDHADDDMLMDAQGDGDGDEGVAVDEVGGACLEGEGGVERVRSGGGLEGRRGGGRKFQLENGGEWN